jgi:uncharacterized membrane protein YtjA (UPF0391 family)
VSPDATRAVEPIACKSPRGHTGCTAAAPITPGAAPEWIHPPIPTRSFAMLHYAVVFFVIALIAAVFGFGGIAASAVGIAKILFIIFAVLAVASFLFGLVR